MDVGQETMQVEFYLPVQATLTEGWQDAVWDEALKHAHQMGRIPVGPILISDPEPFKQPQGLREGVPMAIGGPMPHIDIVRVVATLMLGV